LPLLIGLLLAWWRMPFTITRPTGSDGYRQTTVRRDWNGQLYCYGRTAIFDGQGKKRLEYMNYSRYQVHCVNDLLMPNIRAWDGEGREITVEQLFHERGMSHLLLFRESASGSP
jgi:hypothetical protein